MARRSTARTPAQLRAQLLQELESEGRKIVQSMMSDFTDTLNKQMQKTLTGVSDGTARSFGNLGNIFSTAVSYVLSKPHTTRSTRESDRSVATQQQFRLSQSQAAAEASSALARGNKNT